MTPLGQFLPVHAMDEILEKSIALGTPAPAASRKIRNEFAAHPSVQRELNDQYKRYLTHLYELGRRIIPLEEPLTSSHQASEARKARVVIAPSNARLQLV